MVLEQEVYIVWFQVIDLVNLSREIFQKGKFQNENWIYLFFIFLIGGQFELLKMNFIGIFFWKYRCLIQVDYNKIEYLDVYFKQIIFFGLYFKGEMGRFIERENF